MGPEPAPADGVNNSPRYLDCGSCRRWLNAFASMTIGRGVHGESPQVPPGRAVRAPASAGARNALTRSLGQRDDIFPSDPQKTPAEAGARVWDESGGLIPGA
jgi:hypothetical protein